MPMGSPFPLARRADVADHAQFIKADIIPPAYRVAVLILLSLTYIRLHCPALLLSCPIVCCRLSPSLDADTIGRQNLIEHV